MYLMLAPILILGFAAASYAETLGTAPEPVVELSGDFRQEYDKESFDRIKNAQEFATFENPAVFERIARIMEKTPLSEEAAFAVEKYSRAFKIRVSLLLALMELESDFNKYEVGTHADRGYMQIIPGTEKWLAEEFGEILGLSYDPQRIFEEEYNIGLSALYIDLLQNAYGDNMHRILSEYNRGPYNLRAYYERHQTYSTSYSRKVLSLEKKYIDLNS